MRRIFNALAVSALVLSLSVPAHAAPRRDDGDGFLRNPIKKVVQLVKRFISAPLDGIDVSWPKP